MILQDGMVLCHGSYTEIQSIDLSLCADGKDFGKGFYLTTDSYQAERFVKTAVGKALKNGMTTGHPESGYVSFFRFIMSKTVSCFEFENETREWLHCVVAHRRAALLPKELRKWSGIDVIAGKIANDTTNQVITAYMNGIYGTVGSEPADAMATQLLLPNKLSDQVCFRTEESLQCLSFLGSKEIPIGQ